MQKSFFLKFAALCMSLLCPFTMGFASKEYVEEGYSSDFRGAGIPTEYSETIIYDHKDTASIEIQYGVPYYSLASTDNICANMAGAVIIGYYDRYAENLIPNFKSYNQLGSNIRYKENTREIEVVINTLYDLMNTNVGQVGTDFAGFNNGMNSYVNSHGYSYIQKDVWSNNLENYDKAIDDKQPVAIFTTGFSLVSKLNENNGKDQLNVLKYNDKHIMVGYGYRIDKYYDKNNKLIDTRTYLTVYNGGSRDKNIKYLCLNGKTNIDYAISIAIS